MSCETDKPDMVPLDDFLPYVMHQISGLPAEVAAHHLRLSAIELARHTGILERTIFHTAQEGVGFYELHVGCDEAIMSVRQVIVNGCCYQPYRELCACLPCNHYFYDKQVGLHVHPAGDDRTRGIEVIAKVVPDQDTCHLDRCLYDVHAETVADGAMARLLAIPGAPWQDLGAQRLYARRFSQGRSAAAKLSGKQNMSGPLMVKKRRVV